MKIKFRKTFPAHKTGIKSVTDKTMRHRYKMAKSTVKNDDSFWNGNSEDLNIISKDKKEERIFEKNDSFTESKETKKRLKKKKKIIIRNLSFKVEEDELKEIFSKFGNVLEVKIPLKEDGKKRGFAFVQFEDTKSIIQAIKAMNYKEIQGRKVAVDYALSKVSYQQKLQEVQASQQESQSPAVKQECPTEENSNDAPDFDAVSDKVTKVEESDEDDEDEKRLNAFLKEFYSGADELTKSKSQQLDSKESSSEESDSDDDDGEEFEEDKNKFKEENEESEEESEESDVENEDSDEEEEFKKGKKAIKLEPIEQNIKPRAKVESNDVSEGKTVFLRNISFITEEDDLKEALVEEFGECEYCLLCIDKVTEHPKGTAFIKFKEKTSADKLMEASKSETGILIDGRRLECSLAISRKEASLLTEKPQEKKDKRNLHLLKVGVIATDSEEAKGVSQADLTKRNMLSQMKYRKLRNVNYFVSDKRLMVHNIPENMSDAEFRKIFKKAAGSGTVITEARVMRNLKKTDFSGILVSKGFGFVSFEKHENAMKALNEINNHPTLFGPHRRPIVEFSVESMMALLTQERRKEASKLRNQRRFEEKQERKKLGLIPKNTREQIQKQKNDKKNRRNKQRQLNRNMKQEVDQQNKKNHLGGKQNRQRNFSHQNTHGAVSNSPAKGKKWKWESRNNQKNNSNSKIDKSGDHEETNPKKRKRERKRKGKKNGPETKSISSLIDSYKDRLKNKIK